ncbi:capsular polysaccharide synthesis protein [Maridesulfovibrio sp.]|uniref:capsular polysaccharide synthesis protein n=1 Tax=Maridesulfovibrio sp. TaxID=2795000 RepID=UPI0039F07347
MNKATVQFLCNLIPFPKLRKKTRRRMFAKMMDDCADRIREEISTNNEILSLPTEKAPKIIWQCWLQGEEHAPELVKRCFASVKKHHPDYEVRIITADNYSDYITIPDYIIEKHKKGLIKFAFFADIIRVFLLSQYGGIWIDSTVYCSERIPDEILEQDFFVLQLADFPKYLIGNWFIVSDIHHPLIEVMKQIVLLYWKTENRTIRYLFFHYIFGNVVTKNPVFAEMYQKIPFYADAPPHYVQRYLGREFNLQNGRKLLGQSFLHKLCHKKKLHGIMELLDDFESRS